jgi:PleD family two-component response regulator
MGAVRLKQTVSIGIATWNGRESAESLQRRVDEAMYLAKQSGRDRVELARERKSRPKTRGKPLVKAR